MVFIGIIREQIVWESYREEKDKSGVGPTRTEVRVRLEQTDAKGENVVPLELIAFEKSPRVGLAKLHTPPMILKRIVGIKWFIKINKWTERDERLQEAAWTHWDSLIAIYFRDSLFGHS